MKNFVFFVLVSFFMVSVARSSDWTDGMYLLDFNGIGESDTAKDMSGCNPAEISTSNKKSVVEIYDCDEDDSPTSECDLVVVMGENGLDGWLNTPAYETFHRGFVRAFVKDIGEIGGVIAIQCFGVREKLESLEDVFEEEHPMDYGSPMTSGSWSSVSGN
jgi:hypothetical protein